MKNLWAAEMLGSAGRPRTLEDTLRHLDRAGFSKIGSLEDTPEIAKNISSQLAQGGATEFTLAGTGRSGTFLLSNNGTAVSLRRSHNPPRTPTPFHLQPLSQFDEAKKLFVEVTPTLNTKDVTEIHRAMLNDAVANYVGPHGDRYRVNDNVLRNIGLGPDGVPYYLDGDCISKLSPEEAAKLPAPREDSLLSKYINKDGTWNQYKTFQQQHEAFNSPLHQSGGKIIPVAPEVLVSEASTAKMEHVAAVEVRPVPTQLESAGDAAVGAEAHPPIADIKPAVPLELPEVKVVEPVNLPLAATASTQQVVIADEKATAKVKVNPVAEIKPGSAAAETIAAEAGKGGGAFKWFAKMEPKGKWAVVGGTVAFIGTVGYFTAKALSAKHEKQQQTAGVSLR